MNGDTLKLVIELVVVPFLAAIIARFSSNGRIQNIRQEAAAQRQADTEAAASRERDNQDRAYRFFMDQTLKLTEKLDSTNSALASLQTVTDQQKADIASLTEQLNTSKSDRERLHEQLNSAQTTLDNLTRTIAEKDIALQTATDSKNAAENRAETLANQVAELQAELSVLKEQHDKAIQDLQGQVRKLTEQVGILNVDLSREREGHSAEKARADALQTERDDWKSKFQTLKTQYDTLLDRATQQDQQIQSLQDQVRLLSEIVAPSTALSTGNAKSSGEAQS